MNIYLIEQDENTDWDTYDSAVVIAPDSKSATLIHPNNNSIWNEKEWVYKITLQKSYNWKSWVKPSMVVVTQIGIANKDVESGVICSSFNAG